MMLETPASKSFEAAFDDQAPQADASALDSMFDGPVAGDESPELATKAGEQPPELTTEPVETIEPIAPAPAPIAPPTEEDLAERLWWDKCEVLGKIKDCARMIQEVEGEIDGYKDQIKEAKEVLTGQQALLARYSSQLADILDGHPLPKNPNAVAEGDSGTPGASEPGTGASAGAATDANGVPVAKAIAANDWRAGITSEVVAGLPKMGPKKLESLCELAPTMGQLIDLQIAASRAHIPFKDQLPKGWGAELVDALETRICDYMGQFSDEEPMGDGAAVDAASEPASDDEPMASDAAGDL